MDASLDKKQKAVLLIGAAIVILMGLFPPWYYHVIINKEQHIPFTIRGEYDYGFIFNPPPITVLVKDTNGHPRFINDLDDKTPAHITVLEYTNAHAVPTIDFGRLFVQWATVTIAIASLIFIMKDNKK
jgi:hypothetical protein